MSVETAVAMTVVSLPLLILLGWVVAARLILLGRARCSNTLLGAGELVAGVMLVATPEAAYIHEAYLNGGILAVDPVDLLALGLLGVAGGLIAMLGLSTAWSYRAPRRLQPGARATPPAKR